MEDKKNEINGQITTKCSLSLKDYVNTIPLIPVGGILQPNADITSCTQLYFMCCTEDNKTKLLFTTQKWLEDNGVYPGNSYVVDNDNYEIVNMDCYHSHNLGSDIKAGKIIVIGRDGRRYFSRDYKMLDNINQKISIKFSVDK